MLTRGAVLRQTPGAYEIVELDIEDPRPGEIRVKMAAAGLCHSDDHFAVGTQTPGILPLAGGHEGAGVVEAVGPGTKGFAEGDHVVELVTTRYSLDDITQGFADMNAGRNLRGVVVYD